MKFKSLEQLAIAKLIFLEGITYSNQSTVISNQLAIVTFDLSAATLIIAVCFEKGKSTRDKRGYTLKWEELIDALKKDCSYENDHSINRIKDLHTLRNSIQHGDEIPHPKRIEQFKVDLREFFDDICIKMYHSKITFESISLSKLLKSSHEQQLMELIECYIDNKKYSQAFNLMIICILYRYSLIIENIYPKSLTKYQQIYSYPYKSQKAMGQTNSVQDQFDLLFTGVTDSIKIIALGEFYYIIKNILKREVPEVNLEDITEWMGKMTERHDDIKEDRIKTMYEELNAFLFGTANMLIMRENLSAPVIYDVYVDSITKTSANIHFKILADLPIINFQFSLNNKKIFNPANFKIENGVFNLTELQNSCIYHCQIEVTQQQGEYLPILQRAELNFQTF